MVYMSYNTGIRLHVLISMIIFTLEQILRKKPKKINSKKKKVLTRLPTKKSKNEKIY